MPKIVNNYSADKESLKEAPLQEEGVSKPDHSGHMSLEENNYEPMNHEAIIKANEEQSR